jgi:membrane fusion protein, copper/silver efflux system
MTVTPRRLIGGALALALLGAVLGYGIARHTHPQTQGAAAGAPADGAYKPLYWYDPMVPNQHFDKPGKSPFMDMQLVPRYAGEPADNSAGIRIDSNVTQNLGVRLASVKRGSVSPPIRAPGTVSFNERAIAIVQARATGFVVRVYARATGDVIARGEALVDLLVPDWAAAQTEFVALLKSGDAELTAAARTRLALLGMPSDLIGEIERTRQSRPTITISAPIGGMLESVDVRQGMTVSAGATLAKINGLDPIWFEAAVPEAQGDLTRMGKSVDVRLAAYPGQAYQGQIAAILPQTNPETHTLRVRIELPNHDGRLRPGMFGEVQLHSLERPSELVVPSEAVIHTGMRNVVIVATDKDRFEPVEVQVGPEANGQTSIRGGLQEGQQVVASGQFLIDSEASLRGVLAHWSGAAQNTRGAIDARPLGTGPDAAALFETNGTVQSVSGTLVVVSHEPVKALGWGAMTMPFTIIHPDATPPLKPGDQVKFRFHQVGNDFVIEQLDKVGGAP